MNIGGKRLILLATFTLLSNAGLAGWSTNVWPSTNHWRFTSTSDLVNVPGVVICLFNVSISQSSTTNYIPKLPEAIGSHRLNRGRGAPHVDAYIPPIGGDSTASSRSWTTSYWLNAVMDVPEPRRYFPTYVWTNVYTFAGTQELTTIINEVMTGAKTNIDLDIQQLWAYDSYLALRERWYALNKNTNFDKRYFLDDFYKPRFRNRNYFWYILQGDYRQDNNLVRLKRFWKNIINTINFSDGGRYTNPSADFLTNAFTQGDALPYLFTPAQACANAGIPTNWWEHTPWNNIGGWYDGQGHTVTSTFVMACSGTNECTNSVVDYTGGAHDLVGTNQQVMTIVATNAGVLAGWHEGDYSYRHMQNAIRTISHVLYEAKENITSRPGGTGTATNSWLSAIASAETKSGSSPVSPAYDFLGIKNFGLSPWGQGKWTAFWANHRGGLRCAKFVTNYPVAVSFYYRTIMPVWGVGYTTTNSFHTYDAMGIANIAEDQYTLWEVVGPTNATTVDSVIVSNRSVVSTWGTDPASDTNVRRSVIGHQGDGPYYAVGNYSFEYK